MPNLRELVTVKMVLNVNDKCKNKHPDTLESVLVEWNVLDIFFRFLISEWAQNTPDKK